MTRGAGLALMRQFKMSQLSLIGFDGWSLHVYMTFKLNKHTFIIVSIQTNYNHYFMFGGPVWPIDLAKLNNL